MTPIDRKAICSLAAEIAWRDRSVAILEPALERSTRGEAAPCVKTSADHLVEGIARALACMPIAEVREIGQMIRHRVAKQLSTLAFPERADPHEQP